MNSVSLFFYSVLVFYVQVLKVRKAVPALVGYLVQMENQVREDLKVLKENRVRLDQDPKDAQERRYHTPHTTKHT